MLTLTHQSQQARRRLASRSLSPPKTNKCASRFLSSFQDGLKVETMPSPFRQSRLANVLGQRLVTRQMSHSDLPNLAPSLPPRPPPLPMAGAQHEPMVPALRDAEARAVLHRFEEIFVHTQHLLWTEADRYRGILHHEPGLLQDIKREATRHYMEFQALQPDNQATWSLPLLGVYRAELMPRYLGRGNNLNVNAAQQQPRQGHQAGNGGNPPHQQAKLAPRLPQQLTQYQAQRQAHHQAQEQAQLQAQRQAHHQMLEQAQLQAQRQAHHQMLEQAQLQAQRQTHHQAQGQAHHQAQGQAQQLAQQALQLAEQQAPQQAQSHQHQQHQPTTQPGTFWLYWLCMRQLLTLCVELQVTIKIRMWSLSAASASIHRIALSPQVIHRVAMGRLLSGSESAGTTPKSPTSINASVVAKFPPPSPVVLCTGYQLQWRIIKTRPEMVARHHRLIDVPQPSSHQSAAGRLQFKTTKVVVVSGDRQPSNLPEPRPH